MKKFIAFLVTLVFGIVAASSQTPVITMVTAASIGSTINLTLVAANANTSIQVDFGNGKVTQTVGDSYIGTKISGTLSAHTVNIYGSGIVILDCSNNLLTALDVSKYSTFNELNCQNNQLSALDVTANISLVSLDCSNNKLTTLDISKNTILGTLTCSNNQLTTLDVSKNTALISLTCSNNQLTTLDVSANTALSGFDCSNNKLTALDVSKNTKLFLFYCSNNELIVLDISKNTALYMLNCSSNKLTFTTLPLTQSNWGEYTYASQKPISIVKSLGIGNEVGLISSQFKVNGNTTIYIWKTKSGKLLVEGTDYYKLGDGKYMFQRTADSVYCTMTNNTFAGLVLTTTYTKLGTGSTIENLETPKVEIYTHYKTLYINSPNNLQLSILDINGRLIMSKPINSGTNNVTLHKAGVYIVKLTGSKTTITQKIVIE